MSSDFNHAIICIMKTDIHPKYHNKITATCACGSVFEVGSTKESIAVEICSQCHPFYTGNEKVMDTAGRVERFKKRSAASSVAAAAKPTAVKKPAAESKPTETPLESTSDTEETSTPESIPESTSELTSESTPSDKE